MNRINFSRILSCATGAALLLGLAASSRADYATELLSMGPVNYWRLNEAGPVPPPTVLVNLGSLGIVDNGSPVGVATLGVAGVLPGNSAISVSGNARATIPYDAALNPATFSAEGWFKPNAVGGTTCIMSQFVEGSRSGWLIYQLAGGWSFRLYNQNEGNVSLRIDTTIAPVAGQWYHIAVTFDGTTGIIYVDGVPTSGAATGYVPNVSNPFAIGARADVAFGWNGTADEVAIYSGAIPAGAVAAHYAAATTNAAGYAAQILASSPLGYWRLGEAQYVPLVAANTGTRGTAANGAYNPTIAISDGVRPPTYPGLETGNTAPLFDGATGSIDCGTNASFAGQTDFSVMAWIKTTGTAAAVIAQQRDVDGVVAGYNGEYMLSLNPDGTIQFFLYKDGYQFNFPTVTTVNDGNWHQIAAMRKSYDGYVYVDGAVAGSALGTEIKDLVPQIKTFIGRDMRDFINTFNGSIDEVAMFDKALGQGAVLSLYYTAIGSNAAPVMVSDPPVASPQTIYATTTFTITADIAGVLPMTYEWRKDGTVVGTSRDFTKANAVVADSGTYVVTATNPYGTVTSASVTVTVNPAVPPQIVQQPVSRFVYAGGGASFSVEASGTAPLNYQWKKAGANITGETNVTLLITNASAASVASYSVGVTNVAGGVLSQGASLTIRTPAAGTYENAVVTSGPIGYWRLGETAGSTTVLDYAGGNDGSLTNVTLGLPGYSTVDPNTAASFDRAQLSVVGVPRLTQFNYTGASPSFTLEAWANFADFADNMRIFSKGGPGFAGIGFGVFDGGTVLRFTTYGVQDFNLSLPTALVPSAWYHIVGVASSGSFHYYLNGEHVGSIAFTGAGSPANGNPDFAIGRNGLGVPEAVNGLIDEAAVYNKALTAQEILTHYSLGRFGATTAPFITTQPASQAVVAGATATFSVGAQGSIPLGYQWKKASAAIAGATTSRLTIANASYVDSAAYSVTITNLVGTIDSAAANLTVLPAPTFANLTNDLVLHLRFDGNYSDTSGRANDAYAAGAPPFISGKIGQAVHIDTTPGNNYLTVSDPAQDLTFEDTTDFTVAFWLKYSAGFYDLPIIGNANNSTWNPGWVLSENGGQIIWTAVTGGGGSVIVDPVAGSPLINNGVWHHVVLVMDRTNAVGTTYVDGAQVGVNSLGSLGTLNSGLPLTIGQDPDGSYSSATFDLDDMGIWRRALTGYEALSIYNAAQGAGQSFDVYGPVKVSIVASGATTTIAWQSGTLESSDDPSNPNGWTAVQGASAPTFTITPGPGKKFYRVRL